MIQLPEFMATVERTLGRKITRTDNPGQYEAIESDLNQSLYIVAGPGSGKTTVMALRVLRLVYVNGIDPSTILVTTFTKKAAAELRSRILGWGDLLRKGFIEDLEHNDRRERLQTIDLNQIVIGTLDSISENLLQEYRKPGSPSPVVVEEFIANAMMVRYGLLQGGRYRNEELFNYIVSLRGTRRGLNTGAMGTTLLEIKDRIFHDQVDIDQYCESEEHLGVPVACEAIRAYLQALDERLLYDYAKVEQEFYKKLVDGLLPEFTSKIRFVLVDEYQDTNLLQERIYFELARNALKNGGSVTVVGDDDQSIYRFRGATVDLFTTFQERIQQILGIQSKMITLSKNYRSTENIVGLTSAFITLDNSFQNVRVSAKPPIQHARIGDFKNYPILGMFRDNIETLAEDLSTFVFNVVNGGVRIDCDGGTYTITINPDLGGSPADICVLCSSPQEMKSGNELRLPGLIRRCLQEYPNPINVFNPRGQKLQDIPTVQVLCGLILECIDPDRTVQNSITALPTEARGVFDVWRAVAQNYVHQHPEQKCGITLEQFICAWQQRQQLNISEWKREVPLLDIVYRLITWIPEMQHDVEGLVYLEVITRTITQSAVFTAFGSELIFDKKKA